LLRTKHESDVSKTVYNNPCIAKISSLIISRASHLKIPGGPKMARAALSRRAIDGPCSTSQLPDRFWPKYIVTSTWIGRINMSYAHAQWKANDYSPFMKFYLHISMDRPSAPAHMSDMTCRIGL